jgi:hypothetical protein
MLTHQPQAPNVLHSSRRRSRRPRSAPAAGQTRIPDWVWGAGLGLIVIVAIGGYFILSTGGSSAGTCDKALAPINTSDISAQGFQAEDNGLADVIQRLQSGDRVGAETIFYAGTGGSSTATHAFTHNVDPALREKDEGAAKKLCEEVLNVENIIETRGNNNDFVSSLIRIREQLADASETLGYPRPIQSMNIDAPKPVLVEEVQHARST